MSPLQLFLIRYAVSLALNWINSTKSNSILQASLAVVVGEDKAESIVKILSHDDLIVVTKEEL